nr:hypothetical protein [Cellulosimicrobium sp. MM]
MTPGTTIPDRPRRPAPRLVAGALAVALAVVGLAPATAASAAPEPPSADYASLVDVFVGTEGDYGNDMPAAQAPNGLAKVNPRTTPGRNNTGYDYAQSKISGFTHTNLDGVGGSGGGGDLLVVPTSGSYTARPGTGTYAHPFSHDDEDAGPGFYSVELGNVAGTDGADHWRAGHDRGRGRGGHPLGRAPLRVPRGLDAEPRRGPRDEQHEPPVVLGAGRDARGRHRGAVRTGHGLLLQRGLHAVLHRAHAPARDGADLGRRRPARRRARPRTASTPARSSRSTRRTPGRSGSRSPCRR